MIYQKEEEKKDSSIRITLDESAGEKLESAFLELKKECVKITRSQLACEAIVSYFAHFFGKDRETIKSRYFDPQIYLKGKLGDLKTPEDLEEVLRDTLKKKKGRKKKGK